MQFDLPKEKSSIIKVIGIGGCGSNAVNNMFNKGIKGVNFVVCNTDAQALDLSPVPNKIRLGINLTEGCGAGSIPEIGEKSTQEAQETIQEILNANTKMVFITAGMGGGTGTGGAPVLAKLAHDLGILTVGIVTLPLKYEGPRRTKQALAGLKELRQYVDAIIVISNDKMREIHGNLVLEEAFEKADDVLLSAAKSIAEIITVAGKINVDFEDVKYVMNNSGVAIIGTASAEGEHRALRAVEGALASPLLNDSDIRGASNILLNITSGTNGITMDEVSAIMDRITEEAGVTDIIWGNCRDESLDDKVSVTLIATGFKPNELDENGQIPQQKNKKTVRHLEPIDKETKEIIEKNPENNSNIEPTISKKEPIVQPEPTEQTTFEFDLENSNLRNPIIPDNNELKNQNKFDLSNKSNEETNTNNDQGRKDKLRGFSMDLRNISNIERLENEPAFKRRKTEFIEPEHSSEIPYSRYTLGINEEESGEEGKVELRKNNSFLHDNVD